MSFVALKNMTFISLMTIISKGLGFTRDVLATSLFGVNASVDAFYIAYKIPVFFKTLLTEGGVSQAMVPYFIAYQQKSSSHNLQNLIANGFTRLLLISLLILFFLYLSLPFLVFLFSPGLDLSRNILAQSMLKFLLPSLFFIILTAYFSTILQSYSRFKGLVFNPIILNISLIGWGIGLSSILKTPVFSQIYGLLFASIIQFLYAYHDVKKLNFKLRPRWSKNCFPWRPIIKKIAPALGFNTISQLNFLMGSLFASFLVSGSVTWLYYAERIVFLPVGLITSAWTMVMLPYLSSGTKNKAELLKKSLKWNCSLGLLSTFIFFIGAQPLVRILFKYGAFKEDDVMNTALALQCYSLGLIAFMANKVLGTYFYASLQTKIIFRTSVMTSLVNFGLSLLLIGPLKHAGLAFATALSAWANLLFFCYHAGDKYAGKSAAA